MDAERIAEIAARVEAATPGPWTSWSRRVQRPFTGDGDEDLVDDDGKFVNVRDADFIAHSRADVPYLLHWVEVYKSESERFHAQFVAETLRSSALTAERDALRAVIEEARGMHDEPAAVNPGLCGMCMDARPCDTFSILDRGLKGAGG